MHRLASGLPSILKAMLLASLLLGLQALTACGTTRPPRYIPLTVAIPEMVSAHCPVAERPQAPAQDALDAALISPEQAELAELRRAYAELKGKYIARGAWITTLSDFSLAQEGDRLCERNRADAAIGIAADFNAAAAELRGRAR